MNAARVSPARAPARAARPSTALPLSALLLVGCVDSGGKGDSGAQDLSGMAAAMVAAHNDARSRAEPTPDPALPALQWDEDLAQIAEDWANQCVWEHSMGETGENLAWFSYTVEPAAVVEAWFSEISDYDYATNTCAAGKMCGHYTQVVWRDTTRVGCAMVTCADVEGIGMAGDLWVCEYDPPGNWVGEKPY
jgi:uncharacterized protein YkwD